MCLIHTKTKVTHSAFNGGLCGLCRSISKLEAMNLFVPRNNLAHPLYVRPNVVFTLQFMNVLLYTYRQILLGLDSARLTVFHSF